MKYHYINAVYTRLVIEQHYQPAGADEGRQRNEILVLQRLKHGVYTILELVDGDSLTPEGLRNCLAGRYRRGDTAGDTVLQHITVLVFAGEPTVQQEQVLNNQRPLPVTDGVHRGWIEVSLGKQQVLPVSYGTIILDELEELLRSLLREDLSQYESLDDLDKQVWEETETNPESRFAKPLVTYGLIGINILIWIWMMFLVQVKGVDRNSLLISFGAKYIPGIMSGEFWRFLTPVFLHDLSGPLHVAVNCYSLYVVGPIVEQLYGRTRFTIVYLLAGVFGNIASFINTPVMGVGASGAIFGLLGALLYFGVENPKLFKRYFGYNIFVTIGINIVIGFSIPGIDNFAHLGGLAGGFLAANTVKLKPSSGRITGRLVAFLLMLAAAGVGLFLGFHKPDNVYFTNLTQIEQMVRQGSFDPKKVEELTAGIINDRNTQKEYRAMAYYYDAYAKSVQGRTEQALKSAGELTKIDAFQGHFISGTIYFDTKQYPAARAELQQADKIRPGTRQVRELLQQIPVQ